jgi:hypothetical protein
VPRTRPLYPPEFRWEAIRMVVRVSDEEHPIPEKLAKERPLPGRHLPEDALGSGCHEHGAIGMRRGGQGGFSGGLLAVEVAGSEKGAARMLLC